MGVFAIGIKDAVMASMDRLHHSHLGEDHRAAVLGPPASALMAAYMDFGAATYAAIVEASQQAYEH